MNKSRKTYADVVTGWVSLTAGLTANSVNLPHLETHRQELLQLLAEAQALNAQQAAQTAAKQETTKELQVVLEEGLKLATFLRVGVRQHYGNRSEKLVEFGLQPFRGRRVPPPPEPPPSPEVTAPGEPDSRAGNE